MANFAKDDLVDCIRYNIALMDESGLTAKIIIPPRRRLPAESCQIGESNIGGNNLGQQYLREEGEGSFSSLFHQLDRASSSSSGQEQNQQKNKPPIRDQIRTRLLAKLHEMEQNGKVNKANQPVAQRPTECTIKFVPKIDLMKENIGKSISMTSRLIAEIPLEEDSEIFAEFAKFEAMEGTTGSKRFTILFPFAEQPRCAIQIQIVRTAKIADLIGLACHIYSREQHNPPCSHPNDYDLYLAEEDLEEFDTELPPQDRRRRVADCGFPTLAMVKKASVNRRPSQRILNHQIKIFLVDGRCYTMETESLDISMRQVLEYGLDRKKEDEKDEEEGNNNIIGQMNFFRKLDYVLEPFDQPGVCLDLNSSVSSTGTTDFVLLRMNSARGEILAQRQFGQIGSRHLQTRSLEFSQLNLDMPSGGLSKPSTPISGNEFDWKKHRNRFSLRQSQAKHLQLPASIETMATLGRRTGAELAQMLLDKTLQNGGILLDEFQVNRIHRFQPKTPTRLIMRERCLELIPIQLADHSPTTEEPNNKKKRGMAKNAAKCKKVPWELIAAVEVPPSSEQRQNARRIVRIISLSGISPSLIQHIIDTGKGGRPPSTEGNSAYESSYWKIFLVEAAADEAWQIGVRLSEMLDLRPSQVHTLYNYSAGATLKPFSAAEKAFCAPKSLPKSSAGHSPGNSTSISGEQQQTIGGGVDKAPKKKLSMIFSRMRL